MSSENYEKIKRILWIILIANLSVAAIKIIIGYSINSTSLIADGFHSLTDGSSNIVGLVGMHFASKPTDESHPYGHSKFETLAGLFISIMLLVLGIKIIVNSIFFILHPAAPSVTIASLIPLLISLGINIIVSKYEFQQGKALNSTILTADSLHTRSDIYISLGVLCTLACIRLGFPPIVDAIASLIVSCFVIHAAYEIFSETSGVLVDQAAVSPNEVEKIIMAFSQVKNVHKIRSRGCHHFIYIDLHILVEPDMSVERSHSLMHAIEEKLCCALNKPVQAYIHLEPYYEQPSTVGCAKC